MKISKLKAFVGISLLSSVGLAAVNISPATANDWVSQVQAQLIMAAAAVGLGGYQPINTPKIGQLRDNTQTSLSINLRSGATYGFVGVCDADCGDLDLKLLDSSGNVIDSDVEYDDHPMVSVTPIFSDRYTVQVGMPSCSASFCYYGVGAFGK
ncbi:hypothetical protein Sta7437_4825 (plasmid) [Stanieria cyanosphaera PCC 7437]|uniref:Uncharacterized protein n=1 Tax=Stanieria cyanosphaera (strain ATCC 29371 / PCC 7437) TaxID=111780 RepID=K9Y1Q1_STAC7|nr:hypothetical protein [Stanieria cyanosphaera]AFZ38259.1 hypothetical protein Sta7437_4825 [Stanieria cyanosphaera PCC 7437]